VTGRILLIRHTAVARRWHGVCYGISDTGLSIEGRRHARRLDAELASENVSAVVHSGLRRASMLATLIAHRHGVTPMVDARWRERDFGSWEGRSWNAIWRQTGDEMNRMMHDPDGYRPGGGETGADLAGRVAAAFADLPTGGTVIVISHGGPIATLRACRAQRPLTEAMHFIPEPGTIIALAR
jgi:broad specificity phosphatase PhoE